MTPEQTANLDEILANSAPVVTTAFLVYQTPEGQWAAEHDIEGKSFDLVRTATLDDVIAGAAAVHAGAAGQQTAMQTIMLMDQRARAIQEMALKQQEAQKISSLLDPKKLRNPNA